MVLNVVYLSARLAVLNISETADLLDLSHKIIPEYFYLKFTSSCATTCYTTQFLAYLERLVNFQLISFSEVCKPLFTDKR